ncbi:MAG: prolipoprotein diacylglyceryl transferase [Bacteroidaceae bacterium]|nr:prolipoprotein diacylglyceryl transferase [Bacteroidaceae bacterium]
MLAFITWNPDVIAFSIGPLDVRWYGLCWIVGLMLVYMLEHRLYKEQRIPEEQFDPLFMYCFFGILIGARLGHCLFYEPDYYLTRPLQMILPARPDAAGNWHFTGYEGLASHGGTLGLMLALWLFVRKTGLNIMRVLDNIAIVTPVCACAIRIGNLMNSEIIGKPTDLPWAFVFEHVDQLPRHPGQLYEALCYALFFLIHWACYRLMPRRVGTGFYFGLCLTLIFTARIFIEYTKENQVAFENGMPFNMGQLLSVPFVLLGLYCMFGGRLCKKLAEK